MVLLLAATTLFVFPPQLLHEFTCHADSADSHQCGTEETAVSTQHHHCDILQLYFSPYHPEKKDFAFDSYQFPCKRTVHQQDVALNGCFHSDKNRGPPAFS